MGDKKRKLAEAAAEDPVAAEVKKAKKAKKEKKEKRRAEKDAAATSPAETTEAPQVEEAEEQEPKRERLDQRLLREKKERKKMEKLEKKEKKERLKNGNPDADEAQRREKKERKDKKYNNKKVKKADTSGEPFETPTEQANGDTEPSNAAEEGAEGDAEGKNARFICFVGNLPYSANLESITKHFEKNPPASIRVATKKEDNKKCRGFAFIEFDNFDRMKSCLKLYHHSTFDDGKYPPRAINVELTAGGGGNTDYRKGKIEAKNKKLFEERQRNAKQIQKDKKKHDKSKGSGATGANSVGLDGAGDTTGEDDKYAGVHPSRRPRMW